MPKTPALQLVSSEAPASASLSPKSAVPRASDTLIDAIREAHRRRDALMRAEGSLTRQIKSQCRRATGATPEDGKKEAARKEKEAAAAYAAVCSGNTEGLGGVVYPIVEGLIAGREVISEEHKKAVKHLERLAKQAHVAGFVDETRGFGYVGLGQIIGEAGDLSNYANPAKLWKRFGLGLISSGERQRKFTDPAKAAEAGYSPPRRSLMYVIGDSLIKQQGPYRDLYLQRLAAEHAKAIAEGLTPATTGAETVKSWSDRGLPALVKVSKLTKEHRGAGHMAIRAQRYVEKRLLRELWRAWTNCTVGEWKEAA